MPIRIHPPLHDLGRYRPAGEDALPARGRWVLTIPNGITFQVVSFTNKKLLLRSLERAVRARLVWRRVMPSSGGRNSLSDFVRPPGAWLVHIYRSVRLQRRIDDSPGLFHIILAGK